MSPLRLLILASCLLPWALLPAVALADEPPEVLSSLERSVVAEALAHYGYERDPAPEGKWIEAVDVYALEVFDDRDPVPNFLNVFHVTSRPHVIERELLVSVGDRYDAGLVRESERNMRLLRQVSLVVLIAARGSRPDRVRLVAIVKDVWSLRLNSSFGAGAGALDFLLINPAEENLFGTHTSIGLLYLLERDRQSFGARYVNRRLGGSRLFLGAQATVAFNRDTGEGEGSTGQLIFERPLYSQRSEWGYASRVAWLEEVTRRYVGGDIRPFDFGTERLPQIYHTDRQAAEYFGVRSFGLETKYNFTFGLEIDRRRYTTIDQERFSPEARAAFEREILPVSDTRVSPFVQLQTFSTRFLRTLELETLGLQEDYRLGHDVLVRAHAASRRVGSTRDLVGVLSDVAYTLPLGDGLARALVSSDITVGNDGKNDALFWAQGRVATPSIALGRLHVDGLYATRYEDYLNAPPFALGGNNRLRGYLFDEFQGRDVFVANAEFRTRSIDVLSAQLGGAIFYDLGDAADELAPSSLKQGAGVGARFLFPQADRIVLRVDWAMPLSDSGDALPGSFFATFGQAFAMPLVVQPSVVTNLAPF